MRPEEGFGLGAPAGGRFQLQPPDARMPQWQRVASGLELSLHTYRLGSVIGLGPAERFRKIPEG